MTAAAAARRGITSARALASRHPDLVLTVLLVLLAVLVRGMFAFRAPLFIRHDSIAYLQTGYELARGQGFDLPLRRTPLYPMLIATVVWAFGEDLRALALVQHALGVITVLATYLLGKLVFGRSAGFIAGVLIALSAPLLIYEHYILAEPLFIPLLVAGLALIVLAMRRERWWWYLAGGIVLALAALSRPIGQALLPAVPLAVFVHRRGIRPGIVPAALVVAGFAIVLLPWMVRGALASGRVEGAGAVGQTLIGRIIRHDEGFALPSPDSPGPNADPMGMAVRRLILTQMARDARPSAINHRVQTQFGLSEAEANASLQEVALEIFRDQPGRFLWGTLAKFRRILVGEDERLRVHWSTRKDGELRDEWLAEQSIAHLYSRPSDVEELEYATAEAVTRVFQPYTWRWPLAILIGVGLALGLIRGPRGPTALLSLAVLALVFPSAMLVGQVPRYRYPADPILAVFAGGGLAFAVTWGRDAWRRADRQRKSARTAALSPST